MKYALNDKMSKSFTLTMFINFITADIMGNIVRCGCCS